MECWPISYAFRLFAPSIAGRTTLTRLSFAQAGCCATGFLSGLIPRKLPDSRLQLEQTSPMRGIILSQRCSPDTAGECWRGHTSALEEQIDESKNYKRIHLHLLRGALDGLVLLRLFTTARRKHKRDKSKRQPQCQRQPRCNHRHDGSRLNLRADPSQKLWE